MKLPKLNELVTKENQVRFEYYRSGELWYQVFMWEEYMSGPTDLFLFPVPIDDCGTATFLSQDKSILFMRYIRKYLEKLQKEIDNNDNTVKDRKQELTT